MESFPTSVGTNYDFKPPPYEFTNLNLYNNSVFIDGKGETVSFDMSKTATSINKFQIQFPLPDKEKNYDEYQNTTRKWYSSYKEDQEQAFLPVPMGFQYKKPSPPHIPTPLEKIKGTLDNRLAIKSFSITETPLYPQNYMQMFNSIVHEEIPIDEYLVQKGPKNQKIPVKNHFGEYKPWDAQLIPMKPNPHLFKTYEDYETAMKNWILTIYKTCDVIPMSPEQMQSIIGVEKQPQYRVNKRQRIDKQNISPSDYFSLVSNPIKNLDETKKPSTFSPLALVPPSTFDNDNQNDNNNQKQESFNDFNNDNQEIFNNNSTTFDNDTVLSSNESTKPKAFNDIIPENLQIYSCQKIKNENSLKDQIIRLKHSYESNLLKKELNSRTATTFPFPPSLDPNFSIYRSLSEYGPTGPIPNKLLACGKYWSQFNVFPILPSFTKLHNIYSICECLRDYGIFDPIDNKRASDNGFKYRIYEQILNSFSTYHLKESLVTDIRCFIDILILFHQFSDSITDIPIMYEIPEQLKRNNYKGKRLRRTSSFSSSVMKREASPEVPSDVLVETLHFTLLDYFVTNQMYNFFINLRDQTTSTFFFERRKIHAFSVMNILKAKGDYLFDYISENITKYPKYLTNVLYYLFVCDPNIINVLDEKDFPIITILINLSINSPESFRFLHLRISKSIVLSAYIIKQLAAMNYDAQVLLEKSSEEFLAFLCFILVFKYPKEIITVDVSWILLFATMILNQNTEKGLLIPVIQQQFLNAACTFIQNRMWANQNLEQWEFIIPQLLTTLLSVLSTENDDSILLIGLKCFRRLVWHKTADFVLNDVENILNTFCHIIASHSISMSVSGIRTMKHILVNHFTFLEKVASNKKYLTQLGDVLFVRKEEPLLEMFNLIRIMCLMPNFSKVKNYFQQILIASHFRIGAALNTVVVKAKDRDKMKFKLFVKFLGEKPNIASMLKNIDNIIAKQKP